jgi:hypothetical protein
MAWTLRGMAWQHVESPSLRRVRMPSNPRGKGVILGEGKPENQNSAIIYCFNEAVQTIDMNQVCLCGCIDDRHDTRNTFRHASGRVTVEPARNDLAVRDEGSALPCLPWRTHCLHQM